MTPLLDAIVSKFTSASLNATITGGIHADIASPGTAMPYLVYTVITAPKDPSYGSENPYTATIQFTVFGTQNKTTGTLALAAATAYRALLSLSGATNTQAIQTLEPFPVKQPPEDRTGKDASIVDVWGWVWEVDYTVE